MKRPCGVCQVLTQILHELCIRKHKSGISWTSLLSIKVFFQSFSQYFLNIHLLLINILYLFFLQALNVYMFMVWKILEKKCLPPTNQLQCWWICHMHHTLLIVMYMLNLSCSQALCTVSHSSSTTESGWLIHEAVKIQLNRTLYSSQNPLCFQHSTFYPLSFTNTSIYAAQISPDYLRFSMQCRSPLRSSTVHWFKFGLT